MTHRQVEHRYHEGILLSPRYAGVLSGVRGMRGKMPP